MSRNAFVPCFFREGTCFGRFAAVLACAVTVAVKIGSVVNYAVAVVVYAVSAKLFADLVYRKDFTFAFSPGPVFIACP